MRIAIYSRKSKFTGKGESIENQIKTCKDYANQYLDSIEDIIVYEDEGYSGGSTKRPEFIKMMQDAKNKKFDVLMCYRLNRVSRNVADFSNLIETLQDNDIDFISVREQFDTSTPMGRAMMYIASVFAQLERETIAEQVRDNMLHLATTGRWLGGAPPLGFESKRITYIDNEYKERSLVKLSPIQKEMELVDFFYDLYLELGSIHKVRKHLMQNDIKTRNDAYFSAHTISRILRNPAYVKANNEVVEYLENKNIDVAGQDRINNNRGILTYNKRNKKGSKNDYNEWIAAVAKHNGYVTPDKWLKVQHRLDKNSMKLPRIGTSEVALLSGIIRCSECGSPMSVTYGRKRKDGIAPHYYVCNMKNISGKNKCQNPNATGIDIDNTVVSELLKLSKSKRQLIETLERLKKDTPQEDINILDELKKQRDTLLDEINNLVNEISKSVTASKYIIPQIEVKDEEVKKLDKKIAKLEIKQDKKKNETENFNLVINNILNFARVADELTNKEKKCFLQTIIDKVFWDGKTQTVQIKLLNNIDLSHFCSASSSEWDKNTIILDSKVNNLHRYENLPEDTLGQKIRKLRFMKNLTAKELGKLCGVKEYTIYGYESGWNTPHHTVMRNLIEVFDVPLEYFEDDYYRFVLSDSYCEHLKKWRKEIHYLELENVLGVSYSSYLDWENGDIMARTTFDKIKDKLGI